MLEVIDKGPALESDKTPLLFVHGAWHGAWCWDEHFLDYFAANGCRSLAVNVCQNLCSRCYGSICPEVPKMTSFSRSGKSVRPRRPTTPKQKSTQGWRMT